jgi:hypothetical protein
MMRTAVFILFQFLLLPASYGQSLEYSVHLNSGLYSYAGNSSVSHTFVTERSNSNDVYTNNPYGSNNAISYGLSAQIQRVTENDFFLGVQSGFEVLRSSVQVAQIFSHQYSNSSVSVSGSTKLRLQNINVYPYWGYRLNIKGNDLDVQIGPEMGFILDSRELGEVQAKDGTTYTIENPESHPDMDVRLRASLSFHYKRWMFNSGYSFGVRNFKAGMVGGPVFTAFSRYLRLGIAYRIGK